MNKKYNDQDSPSDEGYGEGRHSSDRNERPHHSDRKFSKSGDRFDRGGGRGHGGGGFDRDRGRGGFDRDRGRGGFDRDRGRGHGGGGFDRDRGGRGAGGSYGRDRGRGPGGGFDRGGGRDGPRGFSKPGRDFSRDRGNNSDSRPSKPWQSNRDERRDSSDRSFAPRANAKHEEAGFQLPEQSELPWRTKEIPNVGQNHEMPEHDGETVDLSDLRSKSDEDLAQQALNLKVKNYADAPKAELLFQVGQKLMHAGTALSAAGVVQMVRRDKVNHGYLRFAENSYAVSPGDVYLGVQPDRRNTWKTGDEISCLLNIPDGEDRYFGMRKIEKINGEVPGVQARRTEFKNCKASHPTERFVLERNIRGDENLTGRAIDIFAPIGKGQRGLLVAQPKSGKTVMLQQIAHALVENHPEVELYILLIDERPEEVSEMESKFKNAQVISSTFDEAPSRHAQVAEMALEKACRQVEAGKDVVIMLDSITRLARAHNALQPPGGRTMSGGLDAKALRLPKRFFGAARNIENGGSLTIIATALVKTGSVMDDVIYEEFKGTGNMEIHLDRWLANRECYPAIALNESSTRKSELLFDAKMRKDIAKLRKFTTDAADIRANTVRYSKEYENATRASKYVIGLMKEFDSNAELLEAKLKDPVWKKPGWER